MARIQPVTSEEEKKLLRKELEQLPIPQFDTLFEEKHTSILPFVMSVASTILVLINIVITIFKK